MGDTMTAPGAAASPEATGRDRRRFPRVKGPFDGSWAGAAGNGSARIWDLSLGGCYIDSMNEQRCGEHVRVDISVPEGRVSAGGVIVYCVLNQGFAVQFADVVPPGLEVLGQTVARLIAEGQGT